MNEQYPALWEKSEPAQIRHLEPDWVESEWFQVWLELARQPHKVECIEVSIEAESEHSAFAHHTVS